MPRYPFIKIYTNFVTENCEMFGQISTASINAINDQFIVLLSYFSGAPFDQLNERATFTDAPVDFYRFHYLNGYYAQSTSCSISKVMFMNGYVENHPYIGSVGQRQIS